MLNTILLSHKILKIELELWRSTGVSLGSPFFFLHILGGNVQNIIKVTYLRIIVGSKLNVKSRVKNLTNRMSKFCGVLYKSRHYFRKNQFLLFYESYPKSVTTYGLIVYGCRTKTTKTIFNEIFNSQKEGFEHFFQTEI